MTPLTMAARGAQSNPGASQPFASAPANARVVDGNV
jgi:hypothetical protein